MSTMFFIISEQSRLLQNLIRISLLFQIQIKIVAVFAGISQSKMDLRLLGQLSVLQVFSGLLSLFIILRQLSRKS